MAKRFTDTDKYNKKFFRSLPGPYKQLWDYLYTECSFAGIWHVDFEVAQVKIGQDNPVEEARALELFNADELRIDVLQGGKKWFVRPFIAFQYGVLKPTNKVHVGVMRQLAREGASIPATGAPLLGSSPSDTPPELFGSPSGGAKEMDMEKEMEKEEQLRSPDEPSPEPVKPIDESDFEPIWSLYPDKTGKKDALRHFLATVKTPADVERIRKALGNYLKSDRVQNGYVKNGSTWFNDWQAWENPTDAMMHGGKKGNGYEPPRPVVQSKPMQELEIKGRDLADGFHKFLLEIRGPGFHISVSHRSETEPEYYFHTDDLPALKKLFSEFVAGGREYVAKARASEDIASAWAFIHERDPAIEIREYELGVFFIGAGIGELWKKWLEVERTPV